MPLSLIQQQKLTQEQIQLQTAMQVLASKLVELPLEGLRERVATELAENPYLEASNSENGDEKQDEEENTRKQSDKNIRKYRRLVVADNAVSEGEFSSEYRGKVQNRNVYVSMQPLFALTYYNKESEVGRIIHYHHNLEELKRTGELPLPLLVTASEQPLNEEQIAFHFSDINTQTAKFSDDGEVAIHYFARGIDFYLVQDLEAAIDDFTQAIIADGDLWMSYYARAVARHKQVEMYRADGESRGQQQTLSSAGDFVVDTRLNDYQLILADLNKAVDLSVGQSFGCPDDNTVSGDLNTDAFPVTADEGIGDGGHGVTSWG